jgi:hypothetical protein
MVILTKKTSLSAKFNGIFDFILQNHLHAEPLIQIKSCTYNYNNTMAKLINIGNVFLNLIKSVAKKDIHSHKNK